MRRCRAIFRQLYLAAMTESLLTSYPHRDDSGSAAEMSFANGEKSVSDWVLAEDRGTFGKAVRKT